MNQQRGTGASETRPRGARAPAENGVTFLELLVTMAIIMVLASAAMPLARVSEKRAKELELRQELRVVRAAIDAFKLDWNRDGDTALGPLCAKNKLTCKEISGVTGYPKKLEALLEVKLSGTEAAASDKFIKRYLRGLPADPMTKKTDWRLRCYSDPTGTSSWCGEDIYDLSSASADAALDGTKYSNW